MALAQEMEAAGRADVEAVEVPSVEFDWLVAEAERMIYVVAGGRLLASKRSATGEHITHAVLADGGPVHAAGEFEVIELGGVQGGGGAQQHERPLPARQRESRCGQGGVRGVRVASLARRCRTVRLGSTMTTVESGPAQAVESVLERIGRAVDMHELERAWCEGLRCHRDRSDRDRILAEAGARISAFGDAEGEPLRRNWLRQVAEEVWLMDDRPFGEPLAAVAMAELREGVSPLLPRISLGCGRRQTADKTLTTTPNARPQPRRGSVTSAAWQSGCAAAGPWLS